MYLSKHFIFSNLDFIFPLELFKYILSLGCLLISRKFASIICDIWGNPLDVEGTQFLPCFFFFSGAFLQMSLEALVAKICICLSSYMKEEKCTKRLKWACAVTRKSFSTFSTFLSFELSVSSESFLSFLFFPCFSSLGRTVKSTHSLLLPAPPPLFLYAGLCPLSAQPPVLSQSSAGEAEPTGDKFRNA